MAILNLCILIVLTLQLWGLGRDAKKVAQKLVELQARYDNLERSGVSLFAKHNELRDRLDKIAPEPRKEVPDVLGRSEQERNEAIQRAALQLLEGRP